MPLVDTRQLVGILDAAQNRGLREDQLAERNRAALAREALQAEQLGVSRDRLGLAKSADAREQQKFDIANQAALLRNLEDTTATETVSGQLSPQELGRLQTAQAESEQAIQKDYDDRFTQLRIDQGLHSPNEATQANLNKLETNFKKSLKANPVFSGIKIDKDTTIESLAKDPKLTPQQRVQVEGLLGAKQSLQTKIDARAPLEAERSALTAEKDKALKDLGISFKEATSAATALKPSTKQTKIIESADTKLRNIMKTSKSNTERLAAGQALDTLRAEKNATLQKQIVEALKISTAEKKLTTKAGIARVEDRIKTASDLEAAQIKYKALEKYDYLTEDDETAEARAEVARLEKLLDSYTPKKQYK